MIVKIVDCEGNVWIYDRVHKIFYKKYFRSKFGSDESWLLFIKDIEKNKSIDQVLVPNLEKELLSKYLLLSFRNEDDEKKAFSNFIRWVYLLYL